VAGRGTADGPIYHLVSLVYKSMLPKNAEPIFPQKEHLKVTIQQGLVNRWFEILSISINDEAALELTHTLTPDRSSSAHLHLL
jgi:hypothetical protein